MTDLVIPRSEEAAALAEILAALEQPLVAREQPAKLTEFLSRGSQPFQAALKRLRKGLSRRLRDWDVERASRDRKLFHQNV